jgi:hypothetical protein
MKAIVKKSTARAARPFPKLMISTKNTIVFMLEESGKGIALTKNGRTPIGDFAGFTSKDNWSMELFKDFEGTITLSND